MHCGTQHVAQQVRRLLTLCCSGSICFSLQDEGAVTWLGLRGHALLPACTQCNSAPCQPLSDTSQTLQPDGLTAKAKEDTCLAALLCTDSGPI